MNRPYLLVFFLAVSACGPYGYVRKADGNPMAGQKVLMLDSLLFSTAEVDGLPEAVWIAGESDGWKQEWPGDQARASAEFANTLRAKLGEQGITITPQANPQGATLLLRPTVTRLETGGWRDTILVVSVKLSDTNGAVLEEISTKVKARGAFNKFEDRLNQAVLLAAHNVARWVGERTAP